MVECIPGKQEGNGRVVIEQHLSTESLQEQGGGDGADEHLSHVRKRWDFVRQGSRSGQDPNCTPSCSVSSSNTHSSLQLTAPALGLLTLCFTWKNI